MPLIVSIEVVRLLAVDAVLGQCRRQVLHGQRVALVLVHLLRVVLRGVSHLGMLQGIVHDVRDELLRGQRDEADSVGMGESVNESV